MRIRSTAAKYQPLNDRLTVRYVGERIVDHGRDLDCQEDQREESTPVEHETVMMTARPGMYCNKGEARNKCSDFGVRLMDV